jgi:D-alanyl-D-alanine carboxypeptidase (penicillin-binding protein 5/6)
VGQRRLLSIVLGAASENARANESQKLLNWGYTAFDAVKLFDAGQAVATPHVWKGKSPAASSAGPSHRGGRARRQCGKLKTQVQRPDPLVAPFTKGQAIGTPEGGAGRPAAA